MQLNFFVWIREAVRQSVLLGVSDAVQQLGPADEKDDFHQRLQKSLESRAHLTETSSKRGGGRKRLGRTLKDLDPAQSGSQ